MIHRIFRVCFCYYPNFFASKSASRFLIRYLFLLFIVASFAGDDKNILRVWCIFMTVAICIQARIFMFCIQKNKIYLKSYDCVSLCNNTAK